METADTSSEMPEMSIETAERIVETAERSMERKEGVAERAERGKETKERIGEMKERSLERAEGNKYTIETFLYISRKKLATDKRSFLEKYFKHFAIFIWLIAVIYFLLINITPLGEIIRNSSRCSDKKAVMNEKWNGTVYKKERIAHNHNVEGIFITNYQGYLTLIGRNRNLYYLTDLGDSIVKDVGSLKVTIYKKDNIINYDYLINCNE